MDYEYIKQKDIENEINGLDEFEKRQLYQFLTETKHLVPKNDIFVIPSGVLPEVKELIDFMKENKQASFKAQEEEKERLREALLQNTTEPAGQKEETTRDAIFKQKLERFVSIPIVNPIFKVASLLAGEFPDSCKGATLSQPVLQRTQKYYKNNPVLSRLFSQMKQNERQNISAQYKRTKYVSPGYTATAPISKPVEEDDDTVIPDVEIEEDAFGEEDDDSIEVEAGDDPDDGEGEGEDVDEEDPDLDDASAQDAEDAEDLNDSELKGQTDSIVPHPHARRTPKGRGLLVVDYLRPPVGKSSVSYKEPYQRVIN